MSNHTNLLNLPTTYHRGIIIGIVIQVFLIVKIESIPIIVSSASIFDFLKGFVLVCSVMVAYFIYIDTKLFQQENGWPKHRWVCYVIPGLIPGIQIIIGIGYLLNRAAYERRGRPLIGTHLLSTLRNEPWDAMKNFYRGVGVVFSVYFFLLILLAVPLSVLLGEEHVLSTAIGAAIALFTFSFVAYRNLSRSERRKDLDILVRDLLVRTMTVVGLVVNVLALIFLIMLPVAILLLPIGFYNESLYEALGFATLFALFILPLSVAFLLPIRLLPWINALPLIGRDLLSKLKTASKYRVPKGDRAKVKTASEGILPRSGYNYTDVSVDSHMEFEGYYGYRPTPVENLQLDTLPTSRRWACRLFVFPYLFAVAVFTYVQIRPEKAAELASVLPAENALVTSGSFIGVPRVVLTQLISFVGLPPETISLGFIGLVVPGILMIPAAWHVALEYEALQYRILQRIGGNHHLLLWLVQFVMPVVLLYLWYEDWSGLAWDILSLSGNG